MGNSAVSLGVGSRRALALDGARPGSTAVLSLPLRPAALHNQLCVLLGADAGAGATPAAPQFDAATGERWPLRILLAEDNITNQQVAQRLLAKLGYQPQVVANGLDVLEALRRNDFDLILMDVQMPEMSGTEATRYIRTFWPPSRQPRIVAMTAYGSEENRAWLLATGMDDYLRKPVRVEDLVRVLRAAAIAPHGDRAPAGLAAAEETSATLDLRVFREFLSVVGDDPAADAVFIASYVADMGTQLQQLRVAARGADDTSLARLSHTLEGLSLQLGARDLAILARRVNNCAKGDMQDALALVDSSEQAFGALQRAVAEQIAAGGSGET